MHYKKKKKIYRQIVLLWFPLFCPSFILLALIEWLIDQVIDLFIDSFVHFSSSKGRKEQHSVQLISGHQRPLLRLLQRPPPRLLADERRSGCHGLRHHGEQSDWTWKDIDLWYKLNQIPKMSTCSMSQHPSKNKKLLEYYHLPIVFNMDFYSIQRVKLQ